MDSSQRTENKEDNLNDSWVDIHFQQQQQPQQLSGTQVDLPSLRPSSMYNGAMEKLLLEAQKESRDTSRTASNASSRGSPHNSPKGPHSPKIEVAPTVISVGEAQGESLSSVVQREVGTEWIWDWSSRPEALPPSDFNGRFKHPNTRHRLSVRNKKTGLFALVDNLPVLIFTHACTFVLGAAAMFVYLKKYCNWTMVASTPLD